MCFRNITFYEEIYLFFILNEIWNDKFLYNPSVINCKIYIEGLKLKLAKKMVTMK